MEMVVQCGGCIWIGNNSTTTTGSEHGFILMNDKESPGHSKYSSKLPCMDYGLWLTLSNVRASAEMSELGCSRRFPPATAEHP